MLALLHTCGVPWDGTTTNAAAAGGSMAALTYAHDHGCPLGSYVCVGAAQAGDVSMLEWALVRGGRLVPGDDEGLEELASAAAWGGSVELMRRVFLDEGIPMTASAAKAAAQSGKVRCGLAPLPTASTCQARLNSLRVLRLYRGWRLPGVLVRRDAGSAAPHDHLPWCILPRCLGSPPKALAFNP
jgi:hypothetical protein